MPENADFPRDDLREKLKKPTPEILLAWRNHHNLTLNEAAAAIGCTAGALSYWENKKRPIPYYLGAVLVVAHQKLLLKAAHDDVASTL